MIVDESRKVIYLHNPKCGGTFLRDIYIEKYGQTDATKWWKLFTKEHGTDLAHISYDDLPRFIPEWEEFRLVVMVRNPYNRFYSAVKELENRIGVIKIALSMRESLEYFFYGEFREWSLVKKRYELFRIICPWTYMYYRWELSHVPTDKFCKQIFHFKRIRQDYFLRNKQMPWLNPQSDFIGGKVEVLQYESLSDWGILLDAFGLSEYGNRLKIAKDYEVSETICGMIRKLYPEDSLLFDSYK